MNKYLSFLLISLSLSCQTPQEVKRTDASPLNIVHYEPTNEAIINPERGFLTHQDQKSDADELTTERVKNYRQQGISLILTVYYMQPFRQRLLSEEFLHLIRRNMKVGRKGGAKVVLRFAYTDSEAQKPWDADWHYTEKHLEQLRPIIQENADIIAVYEAGFVGVWGEWYYTDHYGYQPADTPTAYNPRKQVLKKLLSILPTDRMIAVRNPKAKLYTQSISIADTLTAQTAYKGSDLARIGFHNDCFLADDDDMGTYHHLSEHRQYVAHETQYTVMGGETCQPSAFSACTNALQQLATYHFSYLNIDYHQGVIKQWKQQKCIDEIKKRLGYRFVLTEGSFSGYNSAERVLKVSLKIKNEGFAAPFNPRKAVLVLVSEKNPKEKYRFNLNTDPRLWAASKTTTIAAEVSLPSSLRKGKYTLYLHLPDPYPTLYDRPEYSIRLANKDLWDAQTGYNTLAVLNIE